MKACLPRSEFWLFVKIINVTGINSRFIWLDIFGLRINFLHSLMRQNSTARFDVITVGTATADIVVKTKEFKQAWAKAGRSRGDWLCFPLGAKVEIEDYLVSSGGGATNTAVAFARLGLKTGSVFEIGKDPLGRMVCQELEKEKIKLFLSLNKTLATASSVILVSPSGERTVLVHRGAANDLQLKEIPLKSLNTKWAYLAPGGIETKTIHQLIDFCKRHKIKVALNPSRHLIEAKKDIAQILPEVDVLLLNTEEASYLTGLPYAKEKQIFQKLDELVKGILVVTNGPKGLKVSDGNFIWTAGVYKNKKVVDRLGAGDAFGSGFVAGLIKTREGCEKGVCATKNIEYAIRLGSANATSMVESLGAKTGILTKREFQSSSRWRKLNIKVKKI